MLAPSSVPVILPAIDPLLFTLLLGALGWMVSQVGRGGGVQALMRKTPQPTWHALLLTYILYSGRSYFDTLVQHVVATPGKVTFDDELRAIQMISAPVAIGTLLLAGVGLFVFFHLRYTRLSVILFFFAV